MNTDPDAPLNAALDRPLHVAAAALDWTRSPAGGVERKRFHRFGPAESGQVTSLVRYLPGARFPAHPHPEGEEILVLEGVFSDARGDWVAGSWLANPEGFVHAPFSEAGCLIFVKLRQYPGERPQAGLDTLGADFETVAPGVERLSLLEDGRFEERIAIERWDQGARVVLEAPAGVELFVVSGTLRCSQGADCNDLMQNDFLRLPPGGRAECEALTDARVWLKRNAGAVLRGA